MKSLKTALLTLMAMAGLSLNAQAVLFSGAVPGTSDPWLAGTLPGATASAGDVNPAHSPVFAGSLVGLSSITWIATGSVDNTGAPGGGSGTPDGGALTGHTTGVENGIANLVAPINSLVGVWYDSTTLTGQPFFMGSAGTLPVPAGYDQLYLGTMDGFGWYNNSGEFRVQVDGAPSRVPEGGSFMVIYLAAAGLMAGSVIRRMKKA